MNDLTAPSPAAASSPAQAAQRSEALALTGPLSFQTIPEVLEESAKYAARDDLPDRLTIDFAGVTGIDSAAVALLLEWRREAAKRHKRLEFVNLPPNLLALARLYGVEELIQRS